MEGASGGGGACGGMLSGRGADDSAINIEWSYDLFRGNCCEILAMHTRDVSTVPKDDDS